MVDKLRGAIPSTRHKLLSANPHKVLKATPAQFAAFPKQLSMWGNQTYGDCVTAEECYAIACWSILCGLPETFVTEAEAIAWAQQHGFLNGANLTDVMDTRAKSGLLAGTLACLCGPYQGVDYSNEAVLQSAISQGPVKLGLDADALPSTAGEANGWYAITTGTFGNEDHCTGLSAFGTATFIYNALFEAGLVASAAVPAGLDPTTQGYGFFTWNTIGFVTHAWLMGTVGEAWVRLPVTVGQSPTPAPIPIPTPTPTPVPVPVAPTSVTIAVTAHQFFETINYTLTGTNTNGVLSLTGTIPGWLGGTVTASGSETAPHSASALSLSAKLSLFGLLAVLEDVSVLVADVNTKQWLAAFQEALKAATDAGIILPPTFSADVQQLISDLEAPNLTAANLTAVFADLVKLAQDFGFDLPPTPTPVPAGK